MDIGSVVAGLAGLAAASGGLWRFLRYREHLRLVRHIVDHHPESTLRVYLGAAAMPNEPSPRNTETDTINRALKVYELVEGTYDPRAHGAGESQRTPPNTPPRSVPPLAIPPPDGQGDQRS